MFKWLFNKKAQNTAEYAILIGLVVAAAVAMQVYVRRGIQGRLKDAVDHTGAGGTVAGAQLGFSGNQYEPYYIDSNFTTTRNATDSATVNAGGGEARDTTETTTQSGTQIYH